MTPPPPRDASATSGLEPESSLFRSEVALFKAEMRTEMALLRAQLYKDIATQTRVLTGYITFLGFAILILARLIF